MLVMFDVGARFETAMKDTVEEWKKNKNVSGIFVYGSYVRGTVTANSDLDLCVIWAGEEAPVQLLAEYKAVRIDMLFRTIKEIEEILKGKTEDDFKIADVIGMLRGAKVIYDRNKMLRNWQKRAEEYTWSEEVIQQVKKHALDALSAADQLIEAGEEVNAIHELRIGLFDLGRVIAMKNNGFSIIRPAEVLSEVRMLDPIAYPIFLRTFKIKGFDEERLLNILEDIERWIKQGVNRFEQAKADDSATDLLTQAQRGYHRALNLTINGDYELAVIEFRRTIDILGKALLALSGQPNTDPRSLVSELREKEPEFFSEILVKHGAFEFTPQGIKRSIGEAQFVAQRL